MNSRKTLTELEGFLEARAGRLEDAAGMGRIAYQGVVMPTGQAEKECEFMLEQPTVLSSVVVERLADSKVRIVGVLNGILLRKPFSARLKASENPYFHHQIRKPKALPFAEVREIGKANAREGLYMFLAHFAVDDELSERDSLRASGLLVEDFVNHSAGNRVISLWVETFGSRNKELAQRGGFVPINRYAKWKKDHGIAQEEGPVLLEATLERAIENQNFHIARLLRYNPPAFRFSEGGRHLLRAAIRGVSDSDFAEARCLTRKAVTATWNRIHRHVYDVTPTGLPCSGVTGKSRDRVALLTYLRAYPEALWPYDPN